MGETLATAILQRPALLDDVGESLFWSLWAMWDQARRGGVADVNLESSESLIEQLAARGPAALARSPFAYAVRYLGTRRASLLRRAVGR